MKRFARPITVCALILAAVVLLWPDTGWDHTYIETKEHCKERLKAIARVLFEYAKENRDFPRGADGRFSPDQLLCAVSERGESCLAGDLAACTLHSKCDAPWCGFVWCNDPSKEQISKCISESSEKGIKTGSPSIILLCHDEASIHRRKWSGRGSVTLLLSDGRVWEHIINDKAQEKEYRTWLAMKFRQGDYTVPNFLSIY